MTPLRIRPVTRADRDAWRKLRAALWPGEDDEHASEIERHFEGGHPLWQQEVLLAQVDSSIVGLAEVSIRPWAEGCVTRDVGYLEGWYVTPEHRATGIGRALVHAAEQWARARGCTEMASDADPDNQTSHRAHTACGFEDVGLVRCFRKSL